MAVPLCISTGLIRSGSTWSFNVCRELFQRVAMSQRVPFGSTVLQGPQLDTFIEQQWQRAPGPTVIKTQEIGPRAAAVLNAGMARGICTVRDPRDCVASDRAFMGLDVDASIYRVDVSLDSLRATESLQNVLLVRYEQMMANPVGEIKRIATHLGINAPDLLFSEVDQQTNLPASRAICEQLKTRPANQVTQIDSHRVDPRTQLHENHIGSTKVGRWKEDLSAEQGQYLTDYFSPWLLKWGYETPASLEAVSAGAV